MDRLPHPQVLLALGAALTALVLVLLFLAVLRAGRAARLAEPIIWQMNDLATRVQTLSDGQNRLAGGLAQVSDAAARGQAQMLGLMEQRLSDVGRAMGDSLQGSAQRTAQSLGALQARLDAIDKAQANIEKLSGNVLSLQDILSNKQTRGAFGEIQLLDIVAKALPPDSFTAQATLSNGRRADVLIHLPQPPGPIAVDAKFPLEAYEALRAADTPRALSDAQAALRTAMRKHIRDIAERYIIEGETADGALMFLPSEAVYAELHANFADMVREGFAAKVWIVSPTTCMATLTTMRAILKDARMREQAGAIRKTLRLLHRDVEMVVERADRLAQHFNQARGDVEGITTAAGRAGKRAARLDSFEFDDLDGEPVPPVLRAGE
ncbi:MAG: DNA recombination protein RmuC [Rhodobacteraceae bacterium]|jgi:DNA recombination protein RmuC|nr:DNA recombination protein RmuC [Paracoccaceae bacterium]